MFRDNDATMSGSMGGALYCRMPNDAVEAVVFDRGNRVLQFRSRISIDNVIFHENEAVCASCPGGALYLTNGLVLGVPALTNI